ncbi:MAG: response regulator transcription factor [Bacteroidota bacterium]
MSIKIGILEDDAYVLEEITSMVKSSDKLEYAMAASTGKAFLKYLPSTQLDILLTDIGLPDMSGIEVIVKVKSKYPDLEVIVLSAFHDNDTIFKALRAGASGYLLKDASYDEIEQQIVATKAGKPALSPAIASRMISFFNGKQHPHQDYQLGKKERQVLQLLIEGLSYKLIATELDVSIDGVRYHIKKIYKKLHINSRPELMKMHMNGQVRW